MDISLLNILRTVSWDFRRDMAQNYANMLKNAIDLHVENNVEKHEGFFLSKKGIANEDADKRVRGNFEDKLYVGNIHRIENHLYWNDEELADDDQIVDVVYIDGPVTRDGGGCSYGTKDWRDQVMYANTIPQVVGHVFYINTPGGESACRKDFEMMINDCREKGKPTVAFVDGMCCSAGVNLACRCDRTVVMNPKDDIGCIGSMAAFWATPDGAVDSRDGSRFIEIVGNASPDKNGPYRDSAEGNYEKLQEEIDASTNEFHQTVRENRPLVTDDMLTGKVFEAQEVIPELVDEIGDFNRAIDCVFAIADGSLPTANATVKPNDEPENQPDEQPENPDEPENLEPNEPEDIATPKNDKTMTDEEKKAQEATEAQAAQEQDPATEQPSAEEAPATESATVNEEKPADEEVKTSEDSPASEGNDTADPPTQEDANELSEVQQALHTAEGLVADRDRTIAELKDQLSAANGEIATLKNGARSEVEEAKKLADEKDTIIAEKDAAIAERDKSIEEKDALIVQLKKQMSDLKAEVKELASNPEPMTAGASAPHDNGTGAPETGPVKSVITPDMSPAEIRKTLREQDKNIAKKRLRQ